MEYILKVEEMSEEKVYSEIERVSDLLLTINPNSPMFNQLQGMLSALQGRQMELAILAKHKPGDQVIEIGKVEETVLTPDYTKEELLKVVVHQYADLQPGDKTNE